MQLYQLDSPSKIELVTNRIYFESIFLSAKLTSKSEMNQYVDLSLFDPIKNEFLQNSRLATFVKNEKEDKNEIIIPEGIRSPSTKKEEPF